MLKMLDIGIENAVAFQLSGKISESNMFLVLSEAREKLKAYGKIVVYEDIISFTGVELSALAEEFKYLLDVGFSNLEKVAVVADKGWVEKIVKLENMIFKNIEMQYFPREEKALALTFLSNQNR